MSFAREEGTMEKEWIVIRKGSKREAGFPLPLFSLI
jgi:hypothetical protein